MATSSAVDRRFEILRQQAAQQANAQSQQEQDQLKRAFARSGGLQSGAYIKAQQGTSDAAARRLQTAQQNIDMQKLAEQQRQEEIQQAQKYQTSEREAGQQFSAGQAEAQRTFVTGEREAGQKYQSGEAKKQREFVTGERQAGQEYQSGEADKQREFITGERAASQDFTSAEAEKQRTFQKDIFDTEQAFKETMFDWQKSAEAKKYDLAVEQLDLEKEAQDFNTMLSSALAAQQGLTGFGFVTPDYIGKKFYGQVATVPSSGGAPGGYIPVGTAAISF